MTTKTVQKATPEKKQVKFKRWFYYLCKLGFGIVGLFYPTRIIGKENLHKRGRYIYACNHLTYIDIPFTQIRMPGIRRYIGKKEFKEGKSAKMLARFGVICIDRDKPEMSAMREILSVLKEENGQIFIFPEGTRNAGDYTKLLPIKHGLAMFAAKSGVPIVPMLLYRPCKPFRMNYMYVGEPLSLPDSGGRMPTAEQLEEYTKYLTHEFEKARVISTDHIENKRWKRKNRLKEGELEKLISEWEATLASQDATQEIQEPESNA